MPKYTYSRYFTQFTDIKSLGVAANKIQVNMNLIYVHVCEWIEKIIQINSIKAATAIYLKTNSNFTKKKKKIDWSVSHTFNYRTSMECM